MKSPRTMLAVFILLALSTLTAWADTPQTLVVFVHGRYQNASGADWIDDNPADDSKVVAFTQPGPFGNIGYMGVQVKGQMRKRIREGYWMRPNQPGVSDAVESTVGRPNTYYVRYDAKDSFYYEPKAAPMVAHEVRAWLKADPSRMGSARNIVWIAHSNGGIIVRHLMSNPAYNDLIARTREVIILGSPNLGSQMADASIDGGRVQNLADALVEADGAVYGPGRIFGQVWSIFDLASKTLKPLLQKAKDDVDAQARTQGWNASQTRAQERVAQATIMAQAFDHELSGRIDQQLTTQYMTALMTPDQPAATALLPTASLPVPFYWVRGGLYPLNFGQIVSKIFGGSEWDQDDVQYFVASEAEMNPRLARAYPKDKNARHNDGVVGVDSAAAIGTPLGGDARKATFSVNHGDLLHEKKIITMVQSEVQNPARVPTASPSPAPSP